MDKEWISKKEMDLLSFLVSYSGVSKKQLFSNIKSGLVCVNGQVVKNEKTMLKEGDQVYLGKKNDAPFEILYEDEDMIAVNKPAGLLTISTATQKEQTCYHMVGEYLKKKNPKAKVFIVHRLDRDTSGVLVFAKNEKMKELLQKNWNENIQKRGYQALVEGKFTKKSGVLKHYLVEDKTTMVKVTNEKNGKLAITEYKVIKEYGNYSLLDINLQTGRKNQIRVQMAAIGHPLAGDKKYNSHKDGYRRLCLHAYCVSFIHPLTGKLLTLESKCPTF